eukprot:961040-Amphidinium_carterae.1
MTPSVIPNTFEEAAPNLDIRPFQQRTLRPGAQDWTNLMPGKARVNNLISARSRRLRHGLTSFP